MWLTLLGWLLDDYVNEYYCLGHEFNLPLEDGNMDVADPAGLVA